MKEKEGKKQTPTRSDTQRARTEANKQRKMQRAAEQAAKASRRSAVKTPHGMGRYLRRIDLEALKVQRAAVTQEQGTCHVTLTRSAAKFGVAE